VLASRRALLAALIGVTAILGLGHAAAAGELPIPQHDPAEVRRRADDILSRPEYRQPAETIPERIQRWFSEQLGKLFSNLAGSGAGTLVAWLVMLAACAVVALLVVRLTRGVQRDPTERHEVMVELTRTPAQWRAEADQLEARGAWKEALRCRYRALVGELVGRDTIPEIPGRTSGEYVRDVAANAPDAAVAFAAATELFELAWYGGRETTAATCARFREVERDVLERKVAV
jgi:hypothetical protein